MPPVYTVPDTNFHLAVMDTRQDRQQILSDFVKRCTSVIEEGFKWAPGLVRSHLAEYALQREHSWQGLRHHTGLALASEIVFNYNGPPSRVTHQNLVRPSFPSTMTTLSVDLIFKLTLIKPPLLIVLK